MEYAVALLFPLLLLIIVFAVSGIFPFGDKSLLLWDMRIQYVGFFGWLSNVFHGDASLFYSSAKGLGGSMVGLFAYYLSSPLNILAVFFDSSQAPELISWLTLIKIPLAGLTAYIFLRKRFHAGWQQVLLSTSYALCGYVLANCSNIMWLDGIIMLPLVVLGTYRLVTDRKCLFLFITVVVTIIANWYTAYMVCLFAVCYFVYAQLELSDFHFCGHGKVFWSAFLRFCITMLLALGTSMAFFLPAILSLMQGKGGTLSFDVHFRANPSDFFSWLCIGSTPSTSESIRPAIYISAFTMVLAFAFLLNKSVSRRRRVASLIMACLFIAAFTFLPFELVWSGFEKSTSFYFRFAFLLDFVFIMQASEGFDALCKRERKPRISLLALATFLFAFLVLVSVGNGIFYSYYYTSKLKVDLICMFLQVFFTVAFGVLLVFAATRYSQEPIKPTKRPSRTLCVACTVIICLLFAGEQAYSIYKVFGHYDKNVSTYESYIQNMQSVYDELSSDAGFKRVGQAGFSYLSSSGSATTAESMVYGVSSYSHYSSTMRNSTEGLICNLGLSKKDVFGTYYNSPMLVPDTLLGVRYILDDSQPYGATECETQSSIPYNNYHVYTNERALGLGYGVASGAGDITWTDDPFVNQELMLADMTGESSSGGESSSEGEASSSIYTASNVIDDSGQDVGSSQTRRWSATVLADGPLYVFTPGLNQTMDKAKLSVNGSAVGTVGGRFSCNAVYVGDFKAGDTVSIDLTVVSASSHPESRKMTDSSTDLDVLWSSIDIVQLETLNVSAFDDALTKLDTGGFTLNSFSDGSLDATFDAASDETLLLSVPYDTGWTVWVDGQKTDFRAAYSGMTAIDVTNGTHAIKMRYTPDGLVAGIVISIVSVVLFALWRVTIRRR